MSMTKMISVRDEVYATLAKLKTPSESFSDLFIRLVKPKKNTSIMDLAGAWEDFPEIEEAFNEIRKRRSRKSGVTF